MRILWRISSFVCLLLLLILLQSLLDSKEKAKEKIFYSYTNNINGFAALLEEEEASALASKNLNSHILVFHVKLVAIH